MQGIDTVFSHGRSACWRRTSRHLVLQGAPCKATATVWRTAVQGNAGNNLLDGAAGVDAMIGGAGNDTYFVDNGGDGVVESANEGNDTVFSPASTYGLTANVENLVLQGGADLQGFGNALANAIFGNTGNNLHRRRRRRRRHERRRRQRYLLRRQCRRRGDRRSRPGQRHGLRFRQLRADAGRGDAGAARHGRSAGLRQWLGKRDLRQRRQQPHRRARRCRCDGGGPATTPTSSTTSRTRWWRVPERAPTPCSPRRTTDCRRM